VAFAFRFVSSLAVSSVAPVDPRDRVHLDRFSPQLGITAAVVLLTVIYSVVQVGFVRSHPPGATTVQPIVTRPPELRAPVAIDARRTAISEWRHDYWSGAARAATRRRPGMIVQVVIFTTAAVVLLLLRSSDLTAQLSVLALALSAVGGGGPLLGVERVLPPGLDRVMTVFTWLAGPLAFPVIALAVLYFPTPSALLRKHRSLHAAAFIAAAPMIALAAATSLYLVGIDRLIDFAVWDATHPAAYFASFAAGLGINVAVIVEGSHRFRFNPDANQRRRIRMALYTAIPGVLAFAVKDGGPIVASLLGTAAPAFSGPMTAFLEALVLLPAFGLTYAVGVARVLGPRVVLRRSLQYALASRTLTVLAVLPAAALIVTLFKKNLAEIITSGSAVYLALLAASVAGLRYRDRAHQWLDQRFFREEYDARTILLSLATGVRFETDPADLSTMVVRQIEQALHPERAAMLVSGIEDGRLAPVARIGAEIPPLPLDSGLVTMLRWSEDPLEIFLDDPRSPARRLPPGEIAWLEQTSSSLIVPVPGQDRSLVGAIVLGAKRSDEAYTAEDRQLLASIAAQLGLVLDIARLRRRTEDSTVATTRVIETPGPPMAECPRCGRCEDAGVATCPTDGAVMQAVASVPRVIEDKYRIEQLIGRGGMGAVYRARDMRLDRLVAVKVVRADLLQDMDARRRFRREAQIVARLQHPGIVSIFDYGTFPDGGAYLVMELVRGEDLRRVLQREGALDPARAARILSAVCQAIAAAHREGVLHRDLKPENILLPEAGDIEAKVLDFGVAKLVGDRADAPSGRDATLTAAGSIVGTPAYMAPEQLRGAPPDQRTDVFALGVIAYELLSGELPFSRGSFADVIVAQDRGARPLAASAARVPAPLDRVVMRALSIDPDRRPPSPHEFAAAVVQAIGSGEPS
jgi:eukaryotic-like serine/threonine-protein kinase